MALETVNNYNHDLCARRKRQLRNMIHKNQVNKKLSI